MTICFFYANGFGIKSPTTSTDWILVNNLANVGFTLATDTVTGGGSAGTQVWKWINLSQFAPGPTFTRHRWESHTNFSNWRSGKMDC